jgi:hypothetical protein
MVCVEEKGSLLEEFSLRVHRHFAEGVCRSLFEERTGTARFGSATRTLVCVECPSTGPLTRDGVLAVLARHAPRHDGVLDPCADDFAFVSFATPEAALQLAVTVQRLVPRARLRVGLAVGRCRMAVCNADGQQFLLLLGKERARVQALTSRAAAGTVQLAPDAYASLQAAISHDLGSCVVLAEFNGEVLTEVSLTLPPDRSADISTFAGLGLT